jgi:Na+/proline symporter
VGDYKSGRSTEQSGEALKKVNAETEKLRTDFKNILQKADVKGDSNDVNYIFLRFVVDYMPMGLVGLLIAVIFLASWGSIAAALNSLASTSVVDIHKKFVKKDCTEAQDYSIAKWYTFAWGAFSIIIAQFAGNMGSLIEAVNVLGSLFYGVILGIFLVAFYMKRIHGNAVFISAIVVEIIIILSFIWPWLTRTFPAVIDKMPYFINNFMDGMSNISFLWLNAIGAIGMILMSFILQLFFRKKTS